jgi:hypothetical protein
METIIEICDSLAERMTSGEILSQEEIITKLLEIRSIAFEEAMGEDL